MMASVFLPISACGFDSATQFLAEVLRLLFVVLAVAVVAGAVVRQVYDTVYHGRQSRIGAYLPDDQLHELAVALRQADRERRRKRARPVRPLQQRSGL